MDDEWLRMEASCPLAAASTPEAAADVVLAQMRAAHPKKGRIAGVVPTEVSDGRYWFDVFFEQP